MLKRLLCGLLFCLFLVPPAAAEELLTAQEIETLLLGNTISGDWGGQYKQYYGEDGFTMYVPASGDSDPGKWRVNSEENTYESWWEGTGWVGYQIARDGDAYLWIDSAGKKFPFVVLDGKQVDW